MKDGGELGSAVGVIDGPEEGNELGRTDGELDGCNVGVFEGLDEGETLGTEEGQLDGYNDGEIEGIEDGSDEGETDGYELLFSENNVPLVFAMYKTNELADAGDEANLCPGMLYAQVNEPV